MIKIGQNTENCNILLISHDLHLSRLINLFMHRNISGEKHSVDSTMHLQ